jgi:hypothetical protein
VIEVWGTDEHRVGLKPIVRWVWAKRGQRVVVPVRPRYQWLYVYGFVRPTLGATWWLLLPSVRAELFSQALAAFAQAVGAGAGPPGQGGKQVLLVLDRAGWHTGAAVQVPDGLTLVPLPAYSPELQPAERLWRLTDEALANRTFADLDELTAVQAERCRSVQAQPERVHALTAYHWWPKAG